MLKSIFRGISYSLPRYGGQFPRSFSLTCQNFDQNQIKEVRVSVEDQIRTIVMNRPEKKNCLSLPMYQALTDALLESNEDPLTNIVVITGVKGSFCAGNELGDFISNVNGQRVPMTKDDLIIVRRHIEGLMMALIDTRKPLIALVNGPAIGIGLTMLPLCDMALASDKSIFQAPFVSIGIVPECASSITFPKIMGYTKANASLTFGERWDAETAFRNHLITRVIPHEEFEARAWERVKEIRKLPINSLIFSKELVMGEERGRLKEAVRREWAILEERFPSEDCFGAVTRLMDKLNK